MTLMLLAEAAITPTTNSAAVWIGAIFVAIGALATALNQIESWLARRSGRDQAERVIAPQPLIIDHAKRYLTRDESDLIFGEIRSRLKRIEESFDEALRDVPSMQAIEGIHSRMNALTEQVAKLVGAFEQSQRKP